MKKSIFFLLFSFCAFVVNAQNYNNIANYHINGTPTHGVKIKTNLPFANMTYMPTVKIEGYAYNDASIINLNLSWYIYNNKFTKMTMSSAGGITPEVWIANENGKVIIFVDMKIYYQRFTVSVFSKGIAEQSGYFANWTVVDEAISGTEQTLIPYKNKFVDVNISGNSQFDGGYLRIGKIGDGGNKEVPLGGLTKQYNIDFTGYRNVNLDQIGARISSLSFNNWQENKAYVQTTGLAFYTNPRGMETGDGELIERMRITPLGNIGIGTENPTSALDVNGTIRSKEVKIEATGWADFVFNKDYKLPSLKDVEKHISEKGTLPNIPSEQEVKENGVDVGDMQVKLLQKIEELTLYVIEQEKAIKALKEENENQDRLIQQLQNNIH